MLSTISDTAASTAQWTDDLTKQQKATLRANWQELIEHLPAPGIAYEWSEIGVSERLKHYMRHHSLMVPDPDAESKWQTSKSVWMWMIELAGDDETIGTDAEGQCKLSTDPPSTPRRAAAGSGMHFTQQATIGGGTIDPSQTVHGEESVAPTLVETNRPKGQSSDDEARDAGQPPLTRWNSVDTNADKWDVAAGSDGLRVRRATGA